MITEHNNYLMLQYFIFKLNKIVLFYSQSFIGKIIRKRTDNGRPRGWLLASQSPDFDQANYVSVLKNSLTSNNLKVIKKIRTEKTEEVSYPTRKLLLKQWRDVFKNSSVYKPGHETTPNNTSVVPYLSYVPEVRVCDILHTGLNWHGWRSTLLEKLWCCVGGRV